MAQKCTFLFNGSNATSGKTWGFSETWYSALTGAAVVAQMDNLMAVRRLILSSDVTCVGYRIGQPGGRSYVVRRSLIAPRANDSSNLPVDSVLCQMQGSDLITVKKFFLHDLPDDWIAGTSIDPARTNAIANAIAAYSAFNFQFRYQNQVAASAPVLSIDLNGNVVTNAPIALVPTNLISFLKCKDINNKTIRGQYAVTAVTDATHFQIAHWPGNVVARSGRVRLVSYLFQNALVLGANGGIVAGASRKVGRPFFQSRGRVSSRR